MDFSDEDKIKATILYHLRRKKVIGGVHTPFDTVKRGFPSHIGKDIEKTAKELIREGLIFTKPTNQGIHISLNKDRLKEVEEFIFKVLGYTFEI
ncbi:MAG: hypothetical protein WC781_03055 [Candidatus Pacearchaeota archaeon]|jgi:hypothetical protein